MIAMAQPENGAPSTGHRSRRSKVKVFLVDDHPLVREGLAQLIQLEKLTAVCGEAEDVPEAVLGIEKTHPDIVITDISLKKTHGMDLIRILQAQHPSLPVLVLSMHDESLYAERVLRAGARGYVTKQEATRMISQAIKTVLAGHIYVSEKVSSRLVGTLLRRPGREQKSAVERLTLREQEVFRFIGRGLGTRHIAEELGVGIKTVETYRARIKEKLKLEDGTQLLKHAVEWVHALHNE